MRVPGDTRIHSHAHTRARKRVEHDSQHFIRLQSASFDNFDMWFTKQRSGSLQRSGVAPELRQVTKSARAVHVRVYQEPDWQHTHRRGRLSTLQTTSIRDGARAHTPAQHTQTRLNISIEAVIMARCTSHAHFNGIDDPWKIPQFKYSAMENSKKSTASMAVGKFFRFKYSATRVLVCRRDVWVDRSRARR